MNNLTWERLFGFRHAFDDPVTVALSIAIVALLLLAPVVILVVTRSAKLSAERTKELWDRYRSWIWLMLSILVPILAGAFWTILAVAVLSFLCYREYARITGLFRERTISAMVVIGILLTTFSILDNWYRFFLALFPLTVGLIASGALIADQPKGYIQRVGLGVFGYALFGCALGSPRLHRQRLELSPDSSPRRLRGRTERYLCLHLRPSFRASKICSEHEPKQNDRWRSRCDRVNHAARGMHCSFHLD